VGEQDLAAPGYRERRVDNGIFQMLVMMPRTTILTNEHTLAATLLLLLLLLFFTLLFHCFCQFSFKFHQKKLNLEYCILPEKQKLSSRTRLNQAHID